MDTSLKIVEKVGMTSFCLAGFFSDNSFFDVIKIHVVDELIYGIMAR